MKLTPADRWFGKCVKERVNWTCERCGKHYPDGGQGLHCSHFFGRRKQSVRLEPLNAFAHCHGCHSHFSQYPYEFDRWVQQKLGKMKYRILIEKSNDLELGTEIGRTKGKGEVSAHFKAEFERMRKLRKEGNIDRIEFIGWL